jgi:hypothetical protein
MGGGEARPRALGYHVGMPPDQQPSNTPARTEETKVPKGGEQKAMSQGTPSAGGVLVHEETLPADARLRGRAKGAAARQESK